MTRKLKIHGLHLHNIRGDIFGGLTAAIEVLEKARARNLGIMVGCMVCSSLSIAPALQLAQFADWVDLDGALWLAEDYPGGVRQESGCLMPPKPGFWGDIR